ncbi:MAG: elongation factor 1-beta [Candidatus Micrarchaeia archaeon]|jgi:translation elongation factor EF-1beta
MADVAVNVKISSEEQDNLEELIEKIKKVCRVNTAELEDIGFGIKIIKAQIFVDDKDEGFDEVEERIKAVEGVSEIDVISMDRQ